MRAAWQSALLGQVLISTWLCLLYCAPLTIGFQGWHEGGAFARQQRCSTRCAASSVGLNDMLQLLQRKQYEIRELEKRHRDPADPVRQRLNFVSETSSLALTRALRLNVLGEREEERRLSLVADMKRRSPTARDLPHDVDDFADAGRRSVELFAGFGANVVMVNTDEMGWGGSLDDLHAVVAARDGGVEEGEGKKEKKHCAVLAKDIYLHPLQIAAAVDAGADGVLLMASVLGPRLEELLDACTVMGTEAVVEVHTPNECEHALELGAMALCLNNWDRVEGLWRANQAEAVHRLIPGNVVTVAAGGIGSSDEARRLHEAGFDAVVLGRALTAHPDPTRLADHIRAVGTQGLR